MNKVAKENASEHTKVIKTKDNTIANLQNFKTLKNSEERELKIKEKKINKKLKNLEGREAQLSGENQNLKTQNNNEGPKSHYYPPSPI